MGTSLFGLRSDVRIALSRARAEARKRGIEVVVTSTFRSRREQQDLFDQFQLGIRQFPVAPPGFSAHELRIAVDLVPVRASDLPVVVEVMRAAGFKWAGDSDRVHFTFQLPPASPQALLQPSRTLPTVSVRPSRGFPIAGRIGAQPLPFTPCGF